MVLQQLAINKMSRYGIDRVTTSKSNDKYVLQDCVVNCGRMHCMLTHMYSVKMSIIENGVH